MSVGGSVIARCPPSGNQEEKRRTLDPSAADFSRADSRSQPYFGGRQLFAERPAEHVDALYGLTGRVEDHDGGLRPFIDVITMLALTTLNIGIFAHIAADPGVDDRGATALEADIKIGRG